MRAFAKPESTSSGQPSPRQESRRETHHQGPARALHRFGGYELAQPAAVRVAGHVTRPIQRALSEQNVADKAARFRDLHALERQHHDAVNQLLGTFSQNPSHDNYTAANDRIKQLKGQINDIHNEMAGLTAEYGSSEDQGLRRSFMQNVVGQQAYSHQLEERFKDFSDRTEIDQDEDEHVQEVHKNRFLAHSLQNLMFETGRGRFNELMDNIDVGRQANDPTRKIKIATLGLGAPKAGLVDAEDTAKGQRTDDGASRAQDANKLQQAGGNLTDFIARKRQQLEQAGDPRTANDERGQIGDLRVFMDRGEMVGDQQLALSSPLVPMYYGHDQDQRVVAYTSPLHTAVHHELGHLTNALKGVETPANVRYQGGLAPLTGEEELHNIHLDQHSDEVLSNEMQLPTRIAHTAFGGLDRANEDLPEDVMQQDLRTWDARTHNIHAGRLLQAIKQSADSANWNRHTRGFGNRPGTVGTFRNNLAQLPQSSQGKQDALRQIQQQAQAAHGQFSPFRKAATTGFYNTLRTMNLGTHQGILNAIAAVNAHRQQHLVDED